MITISDKKYNYGKDYHKYESEYLSGIFIGDKYRIVIPHPNNLGLFFVLKAYFSVVIQKQCIRQLCQEKIFQALSSPCANLRE